MALQFGPQWLRNLTDVGAGSAPQPQSPSYGVKFKLADYRYGREEMLALYSESYSPPEQVIKHQSIFSKENQRPISLNPFSEDEQRLMSQGVNSHIALRSGGRGGISDRGRGRGRGRGDGYVSRQVENGEQPFGRQTSDGWEQVGRKPDRSYSRGYVEDQAAPPGKREFLRSSSNNWRDKKDGEEEESSGSMSGGNTAVPNNAVHWRQPRENREPREITTTNRWGSNRPNWRHIPDQDDSRPPKAREGESDSRGPRKISDCYENEVPEWAGDDVGDDPGTFDAKGVFVPDIMRGRDGYGQEHQRTHFEGQNSRKRVERNGEGGERREGMMKSDRELPNPNNPRNKAVPSSQAPKKSPTTNDQPRRQSPPVSNHQDSKTKPEHTDFISNSMKGDGDSVNCGLPFLEKASNNHSASTGPTGRQEPLYHPQSLREESAKRVDTNMDGDHAARVAKMAETENILHMERSLQNLLAGMTANTEVKSDEEVDVSKGALPLAHKDANKWFYRDPQGKIQGPFNSESMAEWFRIGYFTMSLIVKRGCDDSFKPLGELIKQYGRVPFAPGPPLPPLITSTSQPEEVVAPEVLVPQAPVMTMPAMATPMVPGMMAPSMPSLHDRLLIRSMMLQQEYLKQSLLVQQLQMQTLAKLQEQENFKEYTPDQQHEISMRMMMQNNPLLMQQMQQLQHQQMLLQQEQQQQQQQHRQELQQAQGGLTMGAAAVSSDPFQIPISHPSISLHNVNPTQLPTSTIQTSTTPVTEKEAWANSQHTENSIWSQPPSMWDIDNTNETSQAHKIQMEKWKREKEEEQLKEEEILHQQRIQSKQEELRKQQNELERQREQMRKEKEELERQRKLVEARREEEQRLVQLEVDRQKKEQMEMLKRQQQEEKRRQEGERNKRDQELRKQEEKRRKEEERQMNEEKKRQEQIRLQKEQEELRKRLEAEALEAKRKEELQRQMELKQIQEEEERIKRETAEKEKQQLAMKKQQMEAQRQQESLRKLQQAQKDQLANIQLPASSNWAKHGSHGGVGHSKSLTEIQEEEARKERERQREQQLQKERMQEQAAFITQQQIQNQKTWAAHTPRGSASRGPSLWDIQQQEKENAKKSDKAKGQNHQAKPSLGSGGSGGGGGGLWGANPSWEDSNPVPASAGSIWDMGVPQSIKKPQLGKNSLAAGQNLSQQQQSKKNAKTNKKTPAKQKEVETVQKLFQQNKKQDGFSAWVTDNLSQFSSKIDVPTFVSFIVDVDSPDDVLDYVKTYLGDTKETHEFTRQFLEKRNQYKNQMRLQKQLEEDSIWGPANAINPHSVVSSSEASKAGEGGQGKSKNKKKKKAQKLDGSILGFTVHADPNRKNATGELETID